MAEPTTSHHTTPSRYKSQRRNQVSLDETSSPDLPPSPPVEDGVARSKSRYRRKADARPESPPTETPLPAPLPSRYHSSKQRQSPMQPIYQEQIVQAPAQRPRTNTTTKKTEERMPPAGLRGEQAMSGAEDTHGPQKESNRLQSSQRNAGVALPVSPPQTPLPVTVPTGELFPPPKPVDPPPPPRVDGPPQSGQIRATKSTSDLNRYEGPGEAGCFGGLFKRKKAEPGMNAGQAVRPRTAKGDTPAIRPGAAAGPDAPVSAINAGDRHVLIECGKSRTLFPVTPTTTATDLIKSAATCMSERIDIKSAILLEHFNTVGVQRPLRRYEHIREVMNSWDNDRQNSLILLEPGTGTVEPELTLVGAPKVEPEEQTFCLLHSQKAGKWDKRFITLRPNGQLVCQKDLEKSKDLAIICHLSDFDIYTPTAERSKKKIKPPKKFCFAVKSQQKTSLFESTHDFVHFFSTGDRAEADVFYKAVQSWRSWYLVNVKGEGQKEKDKPKPIIAPAVLRDRSTSNEQVQTHRAKPSMDSHYQLGSFRPFSIDMNQFQERPSDPKSEHGPTHGFEKSSNQFDVNISPERRTTSAKRQHPPVALDKRPQLAEDEPLANLNRSGSVSKRRPSSEHKRPDATEFKDSGLLGRKYSQRRKEYGDKEAERNQAFTTGPSLLNGGAVDGDYSGAGDGLRRNTSVRRSGNSEVKRSSSVRDGNRNGSHPHGNSTDLDRSGTRRQKPKPLIDFTPQYQEPPQHSKKGRGYHPEQLDENGLITNATSPEDPLGVPQQTVFRNTSGQQNGPTSPGLLDLTPQHREPIHHAKKGRGHHVEHANANGGLIGNATSPEDPVGLPQTTTFRGKRAGSVSEQQHRQLSGSRPSDGFTGEGLLASAHNRQGWGGNDKGRGVIDGSRAGGKPLVDLAADSRFVQGSLLNQVERAEGGPIPPPVIDRERRHEREEKYGEGY